MNRAVDHGVQQDVHTQPDVDTATPDLTAGGQPAAGAQEPLAPEAVNRQVVVGDIPVEPPGFQSRASLLAELDRPGARVSVIRPATGLHGLGVTQLAAAYARAKLAAGWRLVAWVNGSDAGSLLAGLAAVADVTNLAAADSGPGITDPGAVVRRGLEADGDRCLLVFDGVPDLEAVRPFVPARGGARVLITSTGPQTADPGNSVLVDVFGAGEASAFLAGQTGLDDEAGAAAVASALGHLPLALSLAVPLIAEQQLGYWGYLDRLQTTPADIYLTGDDDQPYPLGVARAVLMSMQAVRAADRTGVCARVTEMMAVLSPAGVRRELLHAAGQAGVLANGGRRVAADVVDRVLEWLGDRSLLTVSEDGQTLVLHGLLARVILKGLVGRERLTAVCEAAAFVLDLYSRTLAAAQDRRAARAIPQQVTALLARLAGPVTEADEELAWLLLRLRFAAFYHLLELGDSLLEAIEVGEPLAADLERLLGHDHPDTLTSRNSLAAAYLAAGRVTEAIPLFEHVLAERQRLLGPADPETLTSQNNLATAYQDAGRTAEAVRLYELNLELRDQLLGPDHPSTLTSQGNLAAAYRAAGRAAAAIPLLERALSGRERVLGPDHPDTRTSRKNLAEAYQDAGRVADALPLLERTSAGRDRVLRPDHDDRQARRNLPHADLMAGSVADAIPSAERTIPVRKSERPAAAAGPLPPAAFRRPPADPAKRVLPAGLRRPPADPARQPRPRSFARPPAERTDHSAGRAQPVPAHTSSDREIAEAIAAEIPAGLYRAYDKHAAALYGYCHWMLHNSADAASALKDTFVVVAATLDHPSESFKLRPWLFAVARNECRRRIRPATTARDDDDETDSLGEPSAVAPPGPPSPAPPVASDATVTFRAVGQPSPAPPEASDATVTFRAVGQPSPAPPEASDATVTFRAVGSPSGAPRNAPDETMTFAMIGLPSDATMPFRVVSVPANGRAYPDRDHEEAGLRTLASSVLAGLKPREREVIELSFRHDLNDDELAVVLGTSGSRAHTLTSRARRQLEQALGVMHIALTGREACPVLGELLANWDGQLTEDTHDLVRWHIEECQTCAHHKWGALRPAAFSRLLPLALLPPELRAQVLICCNATTPDAVAYRRRVVRRAEAIWRARFSRAVRRVSWPSIRAHPGAAVATAAVAVWIAAAVSVTLLTLTISGTAHAQTDPLADSRTTPAGVAQTTAGPSVSPVAVSATAPASASARPSPVVTRPATNVPSQVQPPPSAEGSRSPSAKPSKSSSAKPSKSPSASPSRSSSASPSPTKSSSPSSSPSPTP